MPSIHTNASQAEWQPGSPVYGPNSIYEGEELVHIKWLSDRRAEGGGVAWLLHFKPPPGKLIKLVAIAQSEEHVFNLEGGRGTKAGEQLRYPGDYSLNPTGQPHSAFIGVETTALVVYSGELDELKSVEIIDADAPR
jgi:hypothetical protein